MHRLVAKHFVPNPLPYIFTCVDHINGVITDNDYRNLRWVNHRLNMMNQHNCKLARFNKKWKKWQGITCKRSVGFFKTFQEARNAALRVRDQIYEEIYQDIINKHATA